MNQPDLIRSSDAEQAKAARIAAQTALINPYFTPREQQERHDYYIAEAERLEGKR